MLRSLAKIVERGHLARGVKPVHWCFDCGSALAEAEILSGEVDVRWNPDGSPEERELPDATVFEADPLLLELEDDDVLDVEDDSPAAGATTLVEALEAVASGEAVTVEGAADASIVDADTADAILDEGAEVDVEAADEE